jgi:eukaryotic-like serine/threonine-protein kinase
MLRKSPTARPTLARSTDVFAAISSEASKVTHSALVSASARVAAESAIADAAARAGESRARDREALTSEAAANLQQIKDRLYSEVLAVCEEASVSNGILRFGKGLLELGQPQKMMPQSDGRPNRPLSGWDICAFCLIRVERALRPSGNIPSPAGTGAPRFQIMDNSYAWSATLAFASVPGDPTYRWREVAFWRMDQFHHENEPFGLAAHDRDFDIALSNTLGIVNIAFGPKPIDAEDEQDFQRRWVFLFSRAITGALERPRQLPIAPNYFG